MPTRSKIVSLARAISLRRDARREGRRVVLTNGCFDILHAGHVSYLEAARRLGDLLIVGVNSDESVTRLKGKGRPVQPQRDRARIIASLQAVDAVVVFREDTPARLVDRLEPDVLVKGADWSRGEIVGRDRVLAAGGRVARIRLRPGVSTSSIIRRIRLRRSAADSDAPDR